MIKKCQVEECEETFDLQEPTRGPYLCRKHELGADEDPELRFQRYQFDRNLNSRRSFIYFDLGESDDSSSEVIDGD